MKISLLSHNVAECTRERSNDIFVNKINTDPVMHPFQRAREYTRALNSVKLDRLFAKPFVSSLAGHIDGVYALAKHRSDLSLLLSGSGDGEIRAWNLTSKQTIWKCFGHKSFVRGLAFVPGQLQGGNAFLSCSDDKTVKMWSISKPGEPLATFDADFLLNSIDHKGGECNTFATAGGDSVQIWDHSRSSPVQTLNWGADNVKHVRFNYTETDILASTSSDRSIVLYDLRMNSALSKVYLQMRSNAIAWNPMEPYYFTVANEDHNCYTFDMRNMSNACNVLKDHAGAVIDLDYSPAGNEIVTGSYDKSIRVFDVRSGHSRDIYHTKRMQHIFCVQYSMDSGYLLSGSDDGNIRLWKANASRKSGILSSRERTALNYSDKLKDKFKHMPEIKRISKHRHIPKMISSISNTKRSMSASQKRKDENERKHTKAPKPRVPERKKPIITVQS